jgi:hypothetical protein
VLRKSGLAALTVFFAALLLAPAQGGANGMSAGISVIGGTKTPISTVPWQVALVRNQSG